MEDPQTVARNAARPNAVHFRESGQALQSLKNHRTGHSSDHNEWMALRALESAVREQTRRHLPELLEMLKKNLVANGVRIHWAETVEQGNAIVARLIGEERIDRMVKSQSAIGAQTALEQAVGSRGVAVAESDLAGSLRRFAPPSSSPAIAPASRDDARGPRLSSPADTGIGDRLHRARQTLRDEFAAAEAGLSGVHFAVAETGTLVLVENEGNARMCSTVPRLHIAVMPLEKMIPRLEDIAPLLSLHTRSVSGQGIAAYVSMISGPRRPGEKDGPDAVHLIILNDARPPPLADSPWRKALRYLRDGVGIGTAHDKADAPPKAHSVGGPRRSNAGDRVGRLRQKMESAGSEFLDARGGDWLAALQAWLAANSIPGCIYAPTTRLGRKIAAGWNVSAPLIPFQRPLADWKDELFAQGGAGVTSTRGGIAETGSLILWSDPLEPRSLSLIPPVHVALLDCRRIYDTLGQAMREQDWRSRMPTNLLLLSGPSCTTSLGADPVIGVHGPKRLLVVLVDGDPAE